MKYSYMSFSTPELSLAEILEAAERFGYDGIEPRLDANHAHGIEVAASAEQRKAARQQVADSPIALACLATSLQYANPADTEKMIAETHERIDLAGDVGAPRLRTFGGQLGEGLSRDGAIDLLARTLSDVADHAAERGVTLCFETHDDWCDPKHVAAVLQRVSHPNIAANWDIMHPVRMGLATIEESFETLRPWIRHLHVHDGVTKDGQLELAPIGTGEIDHKRAIELLAAAGYDGYISGEWIGWEPWETHLPRELATMKGYEQAGA